MGTATDVRRTGLRRDARAYPPGPRSRIPGRLELAFLRDPPGFLQQLASYGELAHFKFRGTDVYLVTNPDWIKQILTADANVFVKGQSMQESKRVLGEGLLTSEGELHHRQRRLIQPAFHQRRVAALAAPMVDLTEGVSAGWHDGQTFDMHVEMARLTIRILADSLYSMDIEREAGEIVDALRHAVSMIGRLTLPGAILWEKSQLPSARSFSRSVERLDRATADILRRRREDGDEGEDVLGLLLSHHADGAMSERQIRDETITLLLAGHETTANLLTWAWYLLDRHPEVQAELHGELDTVVGNRAPTHDDLAALDLTGRVLLEALRLYPPVWAMGRRNLEDYELAGYTIPADSVVAVNQYVMHRDERFFPDPNRFDPQRWTAEERAKRPRFSFFPFGAGPRICLGEGFAFMEARLVLAALARRWRVRVVPGHPVVPAPVLTLRPRHGLQVRLEARV